MLNKLSSEWRARLIQFAKYFVGGSVYFWSGYAVFAFAYTGLGWKWLPSKILADTIGWSLGYLVQRYWAFVPEGKHLREIEHIGRYLTISVIGLALDYAIIAGLFEIGISPYAGFFISSAFFTVWNYFWYKYWVFPATTPT